jgi:sugar phosphate isomerase/epimerase
MKNLSRRNFIRKSTLGLASAGLMFNSVAAGKKSGHTFRYALCSESVKEFTWQEQCKITGNAGFDGIEIAPFTLVKEGVDELTPAIRKEMFGQMKDAGIACAGLHWLFVAPPAGLHFTTPDAALRQKSVDYLNKLIDFCGDMGGKSMVFGSPAQRGSTGGLSVSEATNYFAEGLMKVADHARQRKVSVLIEPLGKSQTDVINTLDEAVRLVKKINHPNIATMFDYHNTENETEPLIKIVERYLGSIRHVHVQNMDGTMLRPGRLPEELVSIMQLLKRNRYKGWVSMEVFDFTPGGKTIAEEGMKALMEIDKKI